MLDYSKKRIIWKFIIITLLFLNAGSIAYAQGFYIDGGISLNMSNYGTKMDEFIADCSKIYSLNRSVLGANVTSGYGIIPGLYIVGNFLYSRDLIRGFGYEINLRSTSLLAGVRWYPFKSNRFLQLGLEAGPSWLSLKNNIGIPDNTGLGIGINSLVGIDFKSSFDSPPFQFCINFLYSNINGGSKITPGISVKIGYRKINYEEYFNTSDASVSAGIFYPVLCLVTAWIGYNMIPSNER